ncbi:MAG: hypothetical protein EBU30_10545 [Synechococcaceae bacterium WB6_3B_236]|nr:hypothetical protein [Synechococcaceae bacterium WB6_3B_236]
MDSGLQSKNLQVESLQWRHLPLLGDPELASFQNQLQLLALRDTPEQVLHWLLPKQPPAPLALVAREPRGPICGVLVAVPTNRRGSCWRLDLLHCLGGAAHSPLAIASQLLKEALERAPGAISWMARRDTSDEIGLAALREQGFQPLQHQQIWLLKDLSQLEACEAIAEPLELQPLTGSNGALLLQLELTATPSQLRQLQDLRSEDLLDDAQAGSCLLVDRQRHQAVAGARLLRRRGGGDTELELSLHPGWRQLLGPPLGLLLMQAAAQVLPVRIRCDSRNTQGLAWLEHQGAETIGEELVLARSLWRRQELVQAPGLASRTLERIVGQWQPGQRPLPEAMRWDWFGSS